MLIKISDIFSVTPGARYESEGPDSGEKFRKEILLPNYIKAREEGEILTVDMDDCYGFATSFLEESFGGLVRELKEKGILRHINIISNDDKTVEDLIKKYVREAEDEI